MRSKFKWIFTLMIAFTMQFSFAQQKTVTGTVSDDFGALPGATVVVKGTKTGVTTDFDGNYSISAKTGDVLEFSFTGKKKMTITVGAKNTYDIVMSGGLEGDEIIVVGYGTATKESFTGTATTVKKENLEAKTVSNISQALRGEVAGVNVITSNGAPGSDATIRIRGFGSVNGNRNPLYVVDGAPYSSDISSINPADIETMTILKDAAATSIYGSRGANGVVLITTKQGKNGKSVVSVDFKTSINTLMLPQYNVIDSPEQYIETMWSSLKTKGALQGEVNPAAYASANLYGATTEAINSHYNIWNVDGSQLIDPATGKIASGVSRKYTPTLWKDAAFRTGYRSEANVQFNGGNEKTKYATSFGYLDDQGYAINSNYTRYTARLSVEHKPKDWLTVGGNMAYTGSKYKNSSSDENTSSSSGNIFALTSTTPAIYDIYLRDDNGNLVADPIYGGYQYDYGTEYNGIAYNRRAWNGTNGIADSHYDLNQTLGTTLLGNFNIKADITKTFSFETRYSGQYQSYDNASRNNPYYGGWVTAGGLLSKDINTITNQNFLQMFRYNKTFGDHGLETFVAHESTEYKLKDFNAAASKAILPNTLDLAQYTTPFGRATSYSQSYTLDSYFAQLNYDYAKKYYVTGSVRRDGSSRFLNNKWGTFGSVGLGWVASKEDFISKYDFINYLKLKASYGVIGDQGTNLQYGWQLLGINQTATGDYSFTQSSVLANPNLTWETSKIVQVGMESTLFDNTLDLNIDYYVKNTDNLFFTQALPPSSGFSTQQYNSGQMRNSGLEFDVAVHLLKAKTANDFKLTLGINGEVLKNRITQMPTPLGSDTPKLFDDGLNLSKNHSIYDWFTREYAGVDVANGAALYNLYYNDVNNDGVYDTGDEDIPNMVTYVDANPDAKIAKTTTSEYFRATQLYVGKSAVPKVRGAFRINAAYKNFDLTAQFSYSIGGYVYDNGYATLMNNRDLIGTNNFHKDILDAWKQPGDVTNVPRLTSGYGTDIAYNQNSTRFLTKADYLSLNNVRLGYNIPEQFISRLKISNLSLYVSGDNLLMFSARKGLNPQTMVSSSNTGIYMPMTTFSFGTKINF